MILAPLLLTLAPLGGSHAELHPADATFFVEVPDAPALLAAYDRAPLLQMLADAKVREVLGGFGVPGDALEMGPALQAALTELLPEGVDPALITGATAVSMSLTLPSGEGEPRFHAIIDYPNAEMAAQVASAAEAMRAAERTDASEAGGEDVRVTAEGSRVTATDLAAGVALGLDENAAFQRCGSALGAGSGVTVLHGFSRVSPYEAVEAASRAAGEPLDPQVGMLRDVGGMGRFRMQLRGDRFVSELFMPDDGERKGRVLGGQPVPSDWLASVPTGQMFVYSAALDGKAAAAHVAALFDGEAGKQIAALVERVGPGFVAYAEPIAGIGLPRSYSWIELKDPEGFQEELTALITEAGAMMPGLAANTRGYRVKDAATGERIEVPVTTIALPPEVMQQIPVPGLSPSFAVHDGKLLASLSSMHVKRELKRLYSGEEASATNPLAQSGFSYPEDARSVIWMDWAAMIDGAVGLVRTFGPMLAGMAGGDVPFDFERIPPSETFTRFFRPTFHYSQRVEGGEYRYHEASFGPETWLGLAGMGMAAQSKMSSMGGMPMGGGAMSGGGAGG